LRWPCAVVSALRLEDHQASLRRPTNVTSQIREVNLRLNAVSLRKCVDTSRGVFLRAVLGPFHARDLYPPHPTSPLVNCSKFLFFISNFNSFSKYGAQISSSFSIGAHHVSFTSWSKPVCLLLSLVCMLLPIQTYSRI
jgi:hypothetical protein